MHFRYTVEGSGVGNRIKSRTGMEATLWGRDTGMILYIVF